MGWDSAKRYKPRPIGETGAYKPAPPKLVLPEEEPEVLSEEDRATIGRYHTALTAMAREDPRFRKNCDTFCNWPDTTRLWWIAKIEDQARRGLDTIGVLVVTRVIMDRME